MPTIKHSTKNTCSRTQWSLGMPLSNFCKDKISCYYWSVVITYMITFKGLYLCWFITNTKVHYMMEVYCGQKSIYCNRTDFQNCYQVFALDLSSLSSLCNQVFAIEFLQVESFVNWVFLRSSFYRQIFAIRFLQWWQVFAIECLQLSFCNWVFTINCIVIEHHFLFSPCPYSIQVPVPDTWKAKWKMHGSCRTHWTLT